MAAGPVAFVLGGGGVLGAVEVGMLRALFRAGIQPDMVLGTSIGAVNGALVAADPTEAVDRPAGPALGLTGGQRGVRRLGRPAAAPLRRPHPPALAAGRCAGCWRPSWAWTTTFADLRVPFRCCAANIERAAEHWFDSGPLVPAVLASALGAGSAAARARSTASTTSTAGIVNSIPIGEAVAVGARRIFVLQVGRIERELTPPRRPWEIAQVAFEIARRHRFAREMAALPEGVEVHVLPTGGPKPTRRHARGRTGTWRRWGGGSAGRTPPPRRYLATHLER